jgi:photosystem II stability/assembly factor-like uncharacterized protein
MRRRRFIQAAGGCALGVAGAPAVRAAAPGAGRCDWQSVPFGAGGFIDGFVFHPRERGLLYARTDIGGAYRFDPAAAAWVPLLDHLSKEDADLMGVLSLAVDPNRPERLYAACGLYLAPPARRGALLASDDRGATWRVTELGVHLGGNAPGRGTGERLQVDPNLGEVLLLGTSRDGLMISRDRGQSFDRLGFEPRHVSLVLFDPRSGAPGRASATFYVGSHDLPGLQVTHDGGASFERVAGLPALVPQRAAFDSEGTLYVSFAGGDAGFATNPGNASAGGVWKCAPGGAWTDITPVRPGPGEAGFGYSGLDVDRQRPGRLLVSTIERWRAGDDLFLSEDGGATWTGLAARSTYRLEPWPWLVEYHAAGGRSPMGHWIADLKIDPFDGRRALHGTGFGLWFTQGLDAAGRGAKVEWDFAVAGLEETAVLEVRSPPRGPVLLAAMGDVGGAGWDDVSRPPRERLFTPTSQTDRSVDVAWRAPAILARTSDWPAAAGGYLSTDGGATWRPFESSPPRDPRRECGRIAVSARGGAFVWAPDRQPAWRSADHGRTWRRCAGWPDAAETSLVPLADREREGVFHLHEPARGVIHRSVDGGLHFRPAVTGLPAVAPGQYAQLVCAPGAAGGLWLALPAGLLHLPADGRPARACEAVAEAWMVAVGPGAPGAAHPSVYVWGRVAAAGAPEEGLFRSDDGGRRFVRINDDRHRYGRLLSMTADAREHGTVYLAPHGRGVVVGRLPARG